jgi:DNA-binding transcriptional regulator LsrR (DeoR family)
MKTPRPGPPDEFDQLRLMTKVARLYHERNVRQQEIARRLHLSQPRVSRLLRRAEEAGIVRTTVVVPVGMHTELEDELEARFGLLDAHVVDVAYETEEEIARDLGVAAASHIQTVLFDLDVVGFTSWSRPLQAMVAALQPTQRRAARYVVEMLGGLGHPATQHEVAHATQRLADLTGAEAVFLRTPGVVRSPEVREAIVAQDPYVQQALGMLENIDLALVGIGTLSLSEPLHRSGNTFSPEQLDELRSRGAVGNVNLRFFDEVGRAVESPLDETVIGVTIDQLRRAGRSVVVSGGPSKWRPIHAALLGAWIDVLVTDVGTAEELLRGAAGATPD